MKNDVLRHLFTGFVRLHILYHAAKEPICGVELASEVIDDQDARAHRGSMRADEN